MKAEVQKGVQNKVGKKERKSIFTFSYSLASLCVCSSLRCTNSSRERSLTRFLDAYLIENGRLK